MPCPLSSERHPIHHVEPCKVAETAWASHRIPCHGCHVCMGVMVATHAVGRHGSGASDGDRTAKIGGAVTLVNTDLKRRGEGGRRGRGATAQNESESEGHNSAGPSGKLMPALCDVVPFRIADPQAVSVRCLEHCGGCCDGLNSMQSVLSLL